MAYEADLVRVRVSLTLTLTLTLPLPLPLPLPLTRRLQLIPPKKPILFE